jgi:hypothetical protein
MKAPRDINGNVITAERICNVAHIRTETMFLNVKMLKELIKDD